MDEAAKRCTFAVRYHGHLLRLQRMCRAVFRRYFDRVTLCHYYLNPIYNTVSWRKPYCVRKEDLFPFMTPEIAAARMQTLHRLWKARCIAIKLLKENYVKIFDREHGQFYYGFKGKSKLLPAANWNKPKYCKMRSYPRDIMPIYTIDVAAVVIQRKWKALLIRRFLWALARASYHEQFDPLLGQFTYTRLDTGEVFKHKPKMLGGQPYNPNNIPDWTPEQVSVFMRRIGLKQYLKNFDEYGVDGYTFVLLDYEDYENMDIFNRVHIRKIQVEIAKIYKMEGTGSNLREAHQARREKIRKSKMFSAGAVLIQSIFRGYRVRKEVALVREIERVRQAENHRLQLVIERGSWWMERDLPVHLPPIKDYGRKRDHLTTQGWGHYEGNNFVHTFPELELKKKLEDAKKVSMSQKITKIATKKESFSSSSFGAGNDNLPEPPLPPITLKELKKNVAVMALLNPDDPAEDCHPTRIFTDRLARNGYDRRRKQKFKNEKVDIFIPQPILDSLNGDI